MSSKKCPACLEALDFYIDEGFNVCCGCCGAEIANIKDQFRESQKHHKARHAVLKHQRLIKKTMEQKQ